MTLTRNNPFFAHREEAQDQGKCNGCPSRKVCDKVRSDSDLWALDTFGVDTFMQYVDKVHAMEDGAPTLTLVPGGLPN